MSDDGNDKNKKEKNEKKRTCFLEEDIMNETTNEIGTLVNNQPVYDDEHDKKKKEENKKNNNIGVVEIKMSNENQDEFVMLATNLSAQSKVKPKINAAKKISSPSKGRKVGSKKWINSEVVNLLNTVEILLPAGKEQRERFSMRCHKKDKKWFRIGESCKNKFEKLAFLKKPTSTAEIPLNVLRAKEIKDNISSNEVIGYCEENESDFDGGCDAEDNLDSVTVCKSLTAANLSDTSGEVKRPETNTQ